MKFVAILLLALVACSSAVPIKSNKVDPRVFSFLTDFYNQIIAEPVNVLTSSLAGMLAQITAGLALNGLGGRTEAQIKFLDALGDFFVDFGNSLLDSLTPIADQAIQSLGLTLTQLLANFANGRSERDIFDWFNNIGNTILDSLTPIADQAIQSLGLTLTQLLANFANGAKSPRDIFDWFNNIGNTILDSLTPIADQAIQSLGLTLTQLLANFANGRLNRDFWSDLGQSIVNNLIPVGNELVLSLADALTGLLSGLISQRVVDQRFLFDSFNSILGNITSTVQGALNQAIQSGALILTQILADISIDGILPIIGSRAEKPFDYYVEVLAARVAGIQ
jgi:hypothetical protein